MNSEKLIVNSGDNHEDTKAAKDPCKGARIAGYDKHKHAIWTRGGKLFQVGYDARGNCFTWQVDPGVIAFQPSAFNLQPCSHASA